MQNNVSILQIDLSFAIAQSPLQKLITTCYSLAAGLNKYTVVLTVEQSSDHRSPKQPPKLNRKERKGVEIDYLYRSTVDSDSVRPSVVCGWFKQTESNDLSKPSVKPHLLF